jgi:hypothetical protein
VTTHPTRIAYTDTKNPGVLFVYLQADTPPMELLQMARGVISASSHASKKINDCDAANIMAIVEAPPYLGDGNVLFSENNSEGFEFTVPRYWTDWRDMG